MLEGHDAVLCLVGLPEPLNRADRRAARCWRVAARHLVAAMSEAGVSRLVLMGAAGVGNSVASRRDGSGPLAALAPADVMADKRQEALVRGSALHWTVLRPARLSHARSAPTCTWARTCAGAGAASRPRGSGALMVRLATDSASIGKVLTVA